MDHSCQNSVRWSLRQFLDEKAFMNNGWKIIEAPRTCFASWVDHLARWIAACVVYEDWAFDHAYELWSLVGYEPEIVEELVRMQAR